MDRTIGQLPSVYQNNTKLTSLLDQYSDSTVLHRVIRDSLLPYVDMSPYDTEELLSIHEGTDIDDHLSSVLNRTKELLDMLRETVIESSHRLLGNSHRMDLLDPGRIPSDYSTDSRNRVVDIMSILSQIREMNTGLDAELSPYEILITLERLTISTIPSSRVYLGSYMDTIPMIVKTLNLRDPRLPYLLNEYLVGLIVNTLRSDIPNFVYTYGIIMDSGHYTIKDRTFILSRGQQSHLLCTEYISNAVALSNLRADTIGLVTIDNTVHVYTGSDLFRLILLQLLCAILYAYSTVGFIHRDLHGENVLVVILPEVRAIPIMIPIQNGQFTKQYILTNVLVMIIDYGQSTVNTEVLNSDVYQYSKLISPDSPYILWEYTSGPENDISGVMTAFYRQTDTLDDIGIDIMRLLYRMYTGQSVTREDIHLDDFTRLVMARREQPLRYIQTHPLIEYDTYSAVIDFCTEYSHMYISDSIGLYSDILESTSSDSYELTTVTDTRQLYWYLRYIDKMSLHIDYNSIETNQWYRHSIIKYLMPDTVYNSTDMSNVDVIDAILRHIDPFYASSLLISLYKYLVYFRDYSLNILPLSYDEPEDIPYALIDATETTYPTIANRVRQYIDAMTI